MSVSKTSAAQQTSHSCLSASSENLKQNAINLIGEPFSPHCYELIVKCIQATQIPRQAPGILSTCFSYSRLAYRKRDFQGADKWTTIAFKAIACLRPQNGTDMFILGRCLGIFLSIQSFCHIECRKFHALKKTTRLLVNLSSVTVRTPNGVNRCTAIDIEGWALTILGRLALADGHPNHAVQYSQRALDLAPNKDLQTESCINMILALNIMGKNEESKPYQIKAVQLVPSHPALPKLKEALF